MNQAEFEKVCKSLGFIKKKRFLFRKIEDNILQAIFIGKSSRQGIDISFGAWSLYGELYDEWFSLSGNFCPFDMEKLSVKSSIEIKYSGLQQIKIMRRVSLSLEAKCDIMIEKVLPILNKMTDQASFVEMFELLENTLGPSIPMGFIELCGPYLFLNERRKALERVNRTLANSLCGLYYEYFKLNEPGVETDRLTELINRHVLPSEKLVELHKLIVAGTSDDIQSYLDANLEHNLQLLEKIGIK